MSDTDSHLLHPTQLEPGKEYEVVLRSFFEGTFVGVEGEPGQRVVVFDTGGRTAKGNPTQRRIPFDNYVTASRTITQRRKDDAG